MEMMLSKSWDHKYYTLHQTVKLDALDEYGAQEEVLCELQIRYHHGGEQGEGPYYFKKCFVEFGTPMEVMTREEFNAHADLVDQHEGKEAAVKWIDENIESLADPVMGENHPANVAHKTCTEMQKKFLAMMELGLFKLAITF